MGMVCICRESSLKDGLIVNKLVNRSMDLYRTSGYVSDPYPQTGHVDRLMKEFPEKRKDREHVYPEALMAVLPYFGNIPINLNNTN